ncbi:MAG TPA: ATP-binding protein [Polyangiaceae bacterium]|nr:ATP-binding protein [Polyangiaceae bacterium]
MQANALDVQRREGFEAALFRALMQVAGGFVTCIDSQRRILFLNRTVSRDVTSVLGTPVDTFIAPADRATFVACIEQALSSGEMKEVDYSVPLDDGRSLRFHTLVFPFRGPQGETLAVLLTDESVERRQLARELERSEEFRRLVVEHLPDYVSIVDREHRFVWVNRLAPGLTMSDVIGKELAGFHTPESTLAVTAAIEAALSTATVQQYESEGYGDGKINFHYLVRVVPMMHEGVVETLLMITSDITERKRAEQALRQTEQQLHRAQRIESVGQLAGGIAHDFNNLLQVIAGNVGAAQACLSRGVPLTDELEQALRATERAGELTSHLLAIGRRKHVDSKRVELGSLVANSVRMLRRTLSERVLLRYEPPENSLFVELDAPQFEQVLLNLCVNARDAMPDGGTLTIRIDALDETAVMRVCDTGTGISADNLPRVFEPFFTTKGAGSGLGLAVAAGIVSAHGGSLCAESDGRTGTTMTLRLPLVPAGSDPISPPLEVAVGGSGLLLVAEDEDMVRRQLVRLLEHAGYTVLAAENGARALELFREHQATIDLVLLDVVMPELDGWQAFLQIEKLKPGIKVLFTTGYASNVLPHDFASRGARLLSKPYKAQQLWSQVRELLDQCALAGTAPP